MRNFIAAFVATAIAPTFAANAYAAARDYRFELAGNPQNEGNGTTIVAVRLVHLPDSRPVPGAVIIQNKADMGPIGMAEMSASVNALPERPAGTYRFEIQNGRVWKKPDNWALTLDAKVQGETETVHGSIVVKLEP